MPSPSEANRVNYRLRSTFFYRKLKEYQTATLPIAIANLVPVAHLYDWTEHAAWDIDEEAFDYVSRKNITLISVFCHPRLLREQPSLTAYYRNIAVLSQKSVSYLAGIGTTRLAAFEGHIQGKIVLGDADALRLATLFNTHISLIIDSSLKTFQQDDLLPLLFASAGAQIDGSWRNAIGEEAERVVQEFIIREAVARDLLAALIPRAGLSAEPLQLNNIEQQTGALERYRGLILTNRTSILFSSKPDISLLGADGKTIAVIEVKGGADPAGALECYGAAKKSFERALQNNPVAHTILISNNITKEVETRMLSDPTITSRFDLAQLVGNEVQDHAFGDLIFSLLGLVKDVYGNDQKDGNE